MVYIKPYKLLLKDNIIRKLVSYNVEYEESTARQHVLMSFNCKFALHANANQ